MTARQPRLPLDGWEDFDRFVEWLNTGDGCDGWWAGRRTIDVPVKGDRL